MPSPHPRHTSAGPWYSTYRKGDLTLVYRSDMPELVDLAGTPGPLGSPSDLKGRTTLRVIEPGMVVRLLVHGGMFRHLTGWRFLSTARTMRELDVSAYLASHDVPTPVILAARIVRKGCFHRVEVISRLVPHATDLLTHLERTRDDCEALMAKAGALVRRMHDLGVYHADLHVKNILLDSTGTLWVLDLDKAYRLDHLPVLMKRLNVRRFLLSVRKWQAAGRISPTGTWENSFRDGYGEATREGSSGAGS